MIIVLTESHPHSFFPLQHTVVRTDERSNGIERLAFSLNNNCAVTPSTNKIPMMSSKTKTVVKFTYEPRLEDELGLTKGEYVYVVEKGTDGWWKGEAPNGSVGWFPSNYVKEITPSYDYSPPLSPKTEEASTNGNQGSIENRNPAAAVPAPIAMQPPPPPAQAKASVPRASLEVVVTLYSFDASSSEELSFNKGERLEIVSHPEHNPDWWQARNTHGTIGLVPRNYIEVINPSSTPNRNKKLSMRLKIKAVVKFTYEPRLEDELGLTKGEYVYVVEKSTDGRWKGEAPNGSVGWFPSNCVKEITPSYDYSPPRSPEKVEASTNGNQESIENRNPAAAAPAPIAMQPPPPPRQAKASVPQAFLEVVVALYSSDASSSEELSFNKGERLEIVSHPEHDPDWWQTRNTHGTIGLVQRNYIEVINPSSTPNRNKMLSMRVKIKAVVKFTYEPRLEDELGLTKGEYVYVVEKSTDGRWKGEAPNGSVGWFPSNYVKEITPSYDYSPPLSPKQVVASTNTPSYDYSPPRSPEKVEASTNGNQGSIENRNPAAAVPAPIAMQPPPPPAQAKASVPRASLEVVVALYSFDASSSEELSFNKGEQLEIVSHPVHDPDWWQARNTHGTIGLVPRNYIEGIYPSSSLNQDFASPQYSGKETPTEHEPRFVSSTPSKRASEDKASAVIPKKLRRQ